MIKSTVIVLGLVLIASVSFAKTLTLGYVNFPPYEYEENGKPAGILVMVVQDICKRAGYNLELRYYPFKRALFLTKNGSIDGLFNFYKTAERLNDFDYSEAIITNELVFFVKDSSNMTFNNLNDLKGKVIGVMRGYTYGAAFDNSSLFIKDFSNTHESSFKKMLKGRSDAYLCDKLVGIYFSRNEGLAKELKILPNPLKEMDGHIGFAKGKHTDVINKINETIINMKKTGEIRKIIDDYIESNK